MIGKHTCVAEGMWACGDAGRLGSGPDALVHLHGPALVRWNMSGGTSKGCGPRYTFVFPARGYVRTLRPRDAVQEVVTDADPLLGEVLRSLPDGELPEDLRAALVQAQELENAAPAAQVGHFGNIVKLLSDAGISCPAGWGATQGVARVEAGILYPGGGVLVGLEVGPGGGKRYAYSDLTCTGLAVIDQTPIKTSGNHCSRERVIGLVNAPDWSIVWKEWKDGALTAECRADASGIQRGDYTDSWM